MSLPATQDRRMNVTASQDRRASERFRAFQYTAYVKRSGCLGRIGMSSEAAVVDFNRHGVGLCCDKKFKVGDRLTLSIQSRSAVVRYMRRERGECLLGLQFIEASAPDSVLSSARKSVLAGMEQVILRQLA